MPRGSKRSVKRQKRKARGARMNRSLSVDSVTVKIPFRHFVATGMSGATVSVIGLDLNPFNFTGCRIADVATSFQFYRFAFLKLSTFLSFGGVSLVDSSVSHVTSGGSRTAVAYSEEGTTDLTVPGTFEGLAQLSGFAVSGGVNNRCSLSIGSKSLLKRPVKWWKCSSANSPTYDELIQGSIFYAYDNDASWSGVNGAASLLIEGVIEFQGMTINGVGAEPISPQNFKNLSKPLLMGPDRRVRPDVSEVIAVSEDEKF